MRNEEFITRKFLTLQHINKLLKYSVKYIKSTSKAVNELLISLLSITITEKTIDTLLFLLTVLTGYYQYHKFFFKERNNLILL